jgi:ABC-type Na+ transport system ATPase subunit NatA
VRPDQFRLVLTGRFVATPAARQYLLSCDEFSSTTHPSHVPEVVVPVIETRGLRKSYGGLQALKGVTLTVERGQIYGLLGQNGAGKTTLIKILLGITKLTDGDARLLDAPAGTAAVRARVGYLPEDHQFPGYHSGYSLMDFYGQLYGVPRDDRRRKIPATLELVGIAGRMHSKIKTYSKGMKQRLGIAQALLHDPDVIFLDEPTDGVDPVGRKEIRALMATLKEKGHTIFLNSHLLGEVELICDRVRRADGSEGCIRDRPRPRTGIPRGGGEGAGVRGAAAQPSSDAVGGRARRRAVRRPARAGAGRTGSQPAAPGREEGDAGGRVHGGGGGGRAGHRPP